MIANNTTIILNFKYFACKNTIQNKISLFHKKTNFVKIESVEMFVYYWSFVVLFEQIHIYHFHILKYH